MAMDDNVTRHSASAPTPLRDPTTFVTSHNPKDANAIFLPAQRASWQHLRNTNYLSVSYTTSSFPVSMNDDIDVRTHEQVMAAGTLGLVRPNGTVCRTVDFAPGGDPLMHRTRSLDYGIVIEGELELSLDSGEVCMMKRGDIAVQRGTMHAWRNPSQTEWARMVFVLQDCQPIVLSQRVLKEDLGHGKDSMPPSGNDE